MIKAKVFLSGIIVMAIVGGGLAFKARNYSQSYCIASIYNIPGLCTSYFGTNGAARQATTGTLYFFTTTWDILDCPYTICPFVARLTKE